MDTRDCKYTKSALEPTRFSLAKSYPLGIGQAPEDSPTAPPTRLRLPGAGETRRDCLVVLGLRVGPGPAGFPKARTPGVCTRHCPIPGEPTPPGLRARRRGSAPPYGGSLRASGYVQPRTGTRTALCAPGVGCSGPTLGKDTTPDCVFIEGRAARGERGVIRPPAAAVPSGRPPWVPFLKVSLQYRRCPWAIYM